MAAPGGQNASGVIKSTGAALDVTAKIGFRPRAVWLFTTTKSAFWCEGMADATMYKRVANGDGSLAASGGVTPLAAGFRLGTDSDLNPGTPADIAYLAIP